MPVTTRIEKYRGITLVVRDEWISVILDSHGYEFQGPVTSDEEVKRICRLVIPLLQSLA